MPNASNPLDIYYPNGFTQAVQMYIWDGVKPILWDGSVTFSGSLPSTVAGNKTNDNAAPGSNNIGALVAIANAAAPTYGEGHEVLLSTDLAGNLRVAATISTAGLATSAKQDTGNTSLASIDTKTPALGQALAAASVPVVLTVAQISTLTPPAAITNFALETGGNLAASKTDLDILAGIVSSARAAVNPISGQAGVQGASGVVTALTQRVVLATDVALPTGTNSIGQVTANAGTNLNTSALALETGGNLASAKADLDTIAGGGTPYSYISAGSSNQDSQVVKNSAARLQFISVFATVAAARFVKLYNKATGPTSSDTPVHRIAIPNNTTGAGSNLPIPKDLLFGTGLSFRITTGAADNDTGAASANDVLVNFGYT